MSAKKTTKIQMVELCTNRYFFHGATAPSGPTASSFLRFLDHTQRSNTIGKTPLDE
jgi:hypothetical protein